jgi:hypothetical protein
MKIKTAGVLLLIWPGVILSGQTAPLTLQKAITLPNVAGKFDHFAIDLNTHHLFIAATGNHSIEVLDLSSGKVSESLTQLGKPHGLAWLTRPATLYASDGTQADLNAFAGSPFKLVNSIKLTADADDMVYDAQSNLLYVGHGGSDAANPARIAVIETTKQTQVTDIPVSAHPEGLGIDPATDRIFVNIADSAEVVVIDGTKHVQTAVWRLTQAKDNVPLAYDNEHQLLFVACRAPARLLVLDGNSGKELASLPSDSGADDLFYDTELHRIYLIASGAVDIYEIGANRDVRATGHLRTAAGAKTGLFVPSQHILYVGAPAAGTKQAGILLYSTK